tara:strand:- start:25 stop:294 length:270 start_codon:yes stop_codon:yes gene_type:complete
MHSHTKVKFRQQTEAIFEKLVPLSQIATATASSPAVTTVCHLLSAIPTLAVVVAVALDDGEHVGEHVSAEACLHPRVYILLSATPFGLM